MTQPNALGFLSSVAFVLSAAIPPEDKRHYVCPGSPSTQTTGSVCTVLVLGSDEMKAEAVRDGLKVKFGVKGRRKGPRWSGRYIGVWKESRGNDTIDGVLEAY